MSLGDWFQQSYKRVQHAGLLGARDSVFWLYASILKHVTKIIAKPGENIYEREWDLLIVLDSCRVDALNEVAPEYDFLVDAECGTITSVSSTSEKWHMKTFTEDYQEEIANTVLVTGNYKSSVLDGEKFQELVEVWRQGWDLVPARPVTDAAIEMGRSDQKIDRMIVHYMQPHLPSFPNPPVRPRRRYDGEREEDWHALRRGELTEAEVWDGYTDNLRYVLDDVKLLLNNIDSEKVAITADHGDAKGEWGIYSHPHEQQISCLRVVPWCRTSASDRGCYEPGDYGEEEVILEPRWPEE